MSSRTRGGIILAVQAIIWTLWCFISAGPVALVLGAMQLTLKRDLSANVLLAVLVEMAILGSTAFLLYRVLARADAPRWFWVAAPAGYLVSIGGYVLLERLGNGLVVIPGPATLLEVAAVSAIVSAGAYLGGIRVPVRASAGDPVDGTGADAP